MKISFLQAILSGFSSGTQQASAAIQIILEKLPSNVCMSLHYASVFWPDSFLYVLKSICKFW